MTKAESFGDRLENVNCVTMRGAYAVILDQDAERVAVVKTKAGYFLPGGRIEEGETDKDCLRREGLEEIGYEIEPVEFIGQGLWREHLI